MSQAAPTVDTCDTVTETGDGTDNETRERRPWPSLRIKLILASVLIETLMLSLLVANSLRLMQDHLTAQAEARMEALEASFTVALTSPLAERDYGTLQGLLDGLQRQRDISYLAVIDVDGKVVARAGIDAGTPLPPADRVLDTDDPVFDTRTHIRMFSHDFGELRYGLSTAFLREAQATLLRQSLAIAVTEIIISTLVLAAVGILLTRHLEALTDASVRIARGDYSFDLRIRTRDEVGVLASSFSRMAHAVRERIAALHRSSRQLRRSNADLARMAAVSAHHLQEPLRGIVSYSQLLEHRYGDRMDEDGREFLRILVHEGRHMKSLLEDLEDYVAASTREPQAIPVDADACLTTALARLQSLLEQADAEVTRGRLPAVYAEPAALLQVFGRLLENSVAYHRPDQPPHITVSAYRDAEAWVIVLEDNGQGIPAESLERVFQLFERGATGPSNPRSTGIGLALCRCLVENMGGRIWAVPSTDGASIHIRLTAVEDTGDEDPAAPVLQQS